MNYARNRQVVREMGRTIDMRGHRERMYWERRIVNVGNKGKTLARRHTTSDSIGKRSVWASVIRDSMLGDTK